MEKREKAVNFDEQPSSFIVNKIGKLIDVSGSFCQQLGYDKEYLIGSQLEEIKNLTEDSRRNIRLRNVSKLIGNANPSYTMEIIKPNDTRYIFEIETKPYFENDKLAGEISHITSVMQKPIKKDNIQKAQSERKNIKKLEKKDIRIKKIQKKICRKKNEM
ncbi:MAG: PAS domain-containing protein, partial [Thermoplasmatota archaeon]